MTVALACSGCANKDKPVKVSGVVTLDEVPLAKAMVTFHPIGGGRPALAYTDDQGRFEMNTLSEGDGVLPGEYKVTVQSADPAAPGANQVPPQLEKYQKMMQQSKATKPKNRLSPVHPGYGNVEKTPFRQTVPPAQGLVKLELKRTGP